MMHLANLEMATYVGATSPMDQLPLLAGTLLVGVLAGGFFAWGGLTYSSRFAILEKKHIQAIDACHQELIPQAAKLEAGGPRVKKKILKIDDLRESGAIVHRDLIDGEDVNFSHENLVNRLYSKVTNDEQTGKDIKTKLHDLDRMAEQGQLGMQEHSSDNKNTPLQNAVENLYRLLGQEDPDQLDPQQQVTKLCEMAKDGKIAHYDLGDADPNTGSQPSPDTVGGQGGTTPGPIGGHEGIDTEGELESRIGTIYETYISNDQSQSPRTSQAQLDAIEEELDTLQNRIEDLYRSLNDTRDQATIRHKLTQIEKKIGYANRLESDIQEVTKIIHERQPEDNTGQDGSAQQLLEGLNQLGEEQSGYRNQLSKVHSSLREYDRLSSTLQSGIGANYGNQQATQYDTSDLEELAIQLRSQGSNTLGGTVANFIDGLKDCREQKRRLRQEKNTLETEKEEVQALLKTIQQHIDTETITAPRRDTGVEWLEPLEWIAAGVADEQIGQNNISPAANTVWRDGLETTQSGETLLEQLSNPKHYSEDDFRAAIDNVVSELGTLDRQVQTARDHAKTIKLHLELEEIEHIDPYTDPDWTDVLAATASGIRRGQVGVRYVQDIAADYPTEEVESGGATQLLEYLTNPDKYDKNNVRSVLETNLEYLDRYNDMVGGGAKDIEIQTIKRTADRLKGDIPSIGPDQFEQIIRDHIADREDELDQIDEDKVMRKYAIYQELTGLETLFTELKSTLGGEMGDELEALATDVDEDIAQLETRKGNFTSQFGKGINLIDHNIELAEQFRDRASSAREQGKETEARERYMAANMVVEHTHEMLEGELKKYLKRVP